MSTERKLVAVTDALTSSRYLDAAKALVAGRPELPLDESEFDRAVRLTERCDRLAEDRLRLKQVSEDLAHEERAVLDELLGLLDSSTAADFEIQPDRPQPVRPQPVAGLDPALDFGSGLSADSAATLVSRPPIAPEPSERTEPPRLALWVLGPFRLAIDGRMAIGGEEDRATPVLRFLACTDPAGVHKEQLADRFWPQATARVARRNLHQAIYTIRRTLGRHDAEAELVFANDHYRLGCSVPWRDIDELARAVELGRRYRSTGRGDEAVEAFKRADLLYCGELLAEHPYDEWAYSIRERYRLLHREAAAAIMEHYIEDEDLLSLVQLARRLLQLDPGDEDACRRLMTAHLQLGQNHLAAMAFAAQAEHLRDNHGLDPSPETQELARPLMSGCHLR